MRSEIRAGFCSPSATLHVRRTDSLWLTEDEFDEDALILADWLRKAIPAGTLERLPEKLELLRSQLVASVRARQNAEYHRRIADSLRVKEFYINREWAYELAHLEDYIDD